MLYLAVLSFICQVNAFNEMWYINTTEVNSDPATEVCFYKYDLFPACNLTEVNNCARTAKLICNITELYINIGKVFFSYNMTVVDPINNEPFAYCYIIEINDDKASFFCYDEKEQSIPMFIEVIAFVFTFVLYTVITIAVISLVEAVIKKCLFSKPRH